MSKTTHQQNDDAGSTEVFQEALEGKVLQGLGLAIDNAVAAQQALYVVGQAALAKELQERLSSLEGSTQSDESESEAPSMEELAGRLRGIVEAGREASVDKSVSPGGPAQTTSRLMTAFAVALAMLNEVNVQQMLGYILVALASGVQVKGIGPADARILVELLTRNRLGEFLADLKAAERARSLRNA